MLYRSFSLLLTLLLLLTGQLAQAQTPVLTDFNPKSGPVGTSVVITGSNLTATTCVRFGELSAAFTINSASQITAIVPRVAFSQRISVGSPSSGTATYYSTANFVVTRASNLLSYGPATPNFAGVSGSSQAAPAVGDLDLDGRLDLLVGRADGTVVRYEQAAVNGTAFTNLGSLRDESNAVINMGGNTTVSICDTNGDGKFSVLLGRTDGFVYEYEQTAVGAGIFTLVDSRFGDVATTGNSATAFTDLDDNRRLDVLTGKLDGSIGYFQQYGVYDQQFLRVNTNFNSIDVGDNSAPAVVDLDDNGRLDVLIGTATGRLVRYQQDAAKSLTLNLEDSNFAGISAGSNAKPCVTDIDGDGLLDLLVGRADGTIDRYEQRSAPTALSLSPTVINENVAAGSTVGTFTTTDAQGGPFTYALVAGMGSTDNGSFGLSGSSLTIGVVPDYETKSSYAVRVRTTNSGGLSYEQAFTVTITNVAEVPTVTGLAPASSAVGQQVTVSGTNFSSAGAVTVRFNGTAATTVAVSSNTQLTATIPAGATSGTVTVTNLDGTGSSSGSFTVLGNPETTIVSGPPSLVNTRIVSFTFSSDQSPVQYGTSSASPNTTYPDNSATPRFGPIPDGTFTLSVAAQNTQTGLKDPTPATYTFTVDATAPTVAISSPVGVSGSSTASVPVPFTVTFSEPVTGFSLAGIAVSSGTKGNFVAVSSTQYTFSVTPAGPPATITVDVAAGAAQDAATNQNTAAAQFSVRYAPAAPNTTIVSGPPSLGNSSTVSFRFSSDQSPVDYTTSGAPNASYSGNGASSTFGPIPDGTYTLSVAARNTSTGLTDQTPATYPFTVDTQKPGATISSTGNTSGGSTTTSPIGFTVTFSEQVMGFSLAGITVSGGTKGNFVAVSSTQYTFDLTPAGPATYTVNVAAGVAQDAATNPNTAAPQYTLTYALPVTAAPTVGYPASGSTIASPTPTYSGTAPAGSTVTVYVDNVSIGTITATAGGGWSFPQPSALSQTTHTVKATAQRSGYAVSAFSAANSFTVDTTAPSVPVVSSPADGSFVGTLRPAYSGTGAGGSTITVYVDNVSVGTTTIAAGGSTWSLTQPTDLTQATHTVKVTAADGVGNVSAFSAANSFTVDTTAPTVAVSSSAGSSGTTTSTTPVPFTVTFNEPVTGFSLTGITVSSGTKGGFVAVSASQYTFSVTPTGAGAITVSVAAGAAQDRAGNNNLASPGPAFTLTYQPRPTVTALSTAAELPGMPFTLTGSNFTSASTVTVGGTTASVTYNSATSLTATVPAGAAVGSAAVVVTTSGISSTSAPAFSVLKVYDAAASCLSATPYATTGDGTWHYLLAGGQVVAALHDTNASLGTVGVDFLVTGSAQPVRQDGQGRAYLDRNFHLTASGGAFAGSSVEVRFYGLVSELSRLQAADPAATYANLKTTQYSGPNEDCDLTNNSTTGESRVLSLAASLPGGGVPWFVAQATVADHFSEFYLTSSAAPLPVQLVAFEAQAKGSAVQLTWRTASEVNSARFEVERSLDGRTFGRVGTVAAAGTSASTRAYSYLDAGAPAGQLYYRLRQVDLNGSSAYSPVRAVTVENAALALFPNPTRHGAVTLTGAAPGTAVQVLDALGRPVLAATADAVGTAQLMLPAGLATGVYVVRAAGQALRLTLE